MTPDRFVIVAVGLMLHLINMDLNNKTLLKRLLKELSWNIDYVTLWTYVKKGYLKPSSHIQDGVRIVPIYYERDFDLIVTTLKHLADIGKIRIKGYDKKTN